MPIFTVFTPTFNRAHCLHRVYNSLCKQTFREFEWLIIDDGSTDNTSELVKKWQSEASFTIRYFWQENGHKKKAFNRGVKEASGKFFLPWDSDDAATPDALEVFYKNWLDIPEIERNSFVGVCALCFDDKGNIVGDRFPKDVLDSDSLELRYRYGVRGEKWGFSRTDVLRQHPFPEDIQGHVPEGVVWSAIAKHYKTRFINKPLRIYFPAEDSITQTGKVAGGAEKHAGGHAYWARAVLENEISWFWYRPFWFLKMAANHTRFSLHQKTRNEKYPIRTIAGKLLKTFMLPVGSILYLKDKFR